MSTDKLQAVHEALANVFSESPLISTDTEPSHPVFGNEALSDIFSEPHLISANTEDPFRIIDRAALTGMFGEPIPISTNTKPSSPNFDHQALAKILSEPPATSTHTKPSRPSFDHPALAEILSEQPPTSTNTKSSPPSFDHQGLAEALSELRLVPNNPELSPLSFDTGSSSVPSSDQRDNEEPLAKTVAVASSTNAEDARPQRARSLLTKLHHIFSNKAEPPPSGIEKDPLPPSLSGQRHRPEPIVKASAAAPPTDAESARAQQATSLLVEPVSPTSPNIEPSPHIFGKERSRSVLFGRLDKVEPAEKTDQPDNPEPEASATPSSAGARQERRSLTESHLLSINKETSPPIRETPRPPLSGRRDNAETAAEIVAVALPANTESLRPQQATSPLAELPAPISTDTKSSPADFRTKPSPPSLSGQSDDATPTASTVAAVPPTSESARRQRKSLLAELPAMISANEKPPLPILRQPSRPAPSDQLNHLEPVEKTVSVAPPTSAEGAVQPRDSEPLPSKVPSLGSTIPKPPPLIFENEPSPISLSDQPDHAEPAARIVAASHPSDTEGARPQQRTSWLAQLRPSRSFFEKERSPTPLSGELDNVAPAAKVAAAPPADTESAATRAQQAKSLLAELDLSTAIRLRWVMRDIRGKRTKLSPVSDNDLTALMDLGLVEMREELPRLTALGVLALE